MSKVIHLFKNGIISLLKNSAEMERLTISICFYLTDKLVIFDHGFAPFWAKFLPFENAVTSDVVHRGCHDVLRGQGVFKSTNLLKNGAKTWSKNCVFVKFVNVLVIKQKRGWCSILSSPPRSILDWLLSDWLKINNVFLTWFTFVCFSQFLCPFRNIICFLETFQSWRKLVQHIHEELGRVIN